MIGEHSNYATAVDSQSLNTYAKSVPQWRHDCQYCRFVRRDGKRDLYHCDHLAIRIYVIRTGDDLLMCQGSTKSFEAIDAL